MDVFECVACSALKRLILLEIVRSRYTLETAENYPKLPKSVRIVRTVCVHYMGGVYSGFGNVVGIPLQSWLTDFSAF